MEHLLELGLFAGKAVVVLLIFAAMLILILTLSLRARATKGQFEIEKLNEKFEGYKNSLSEFLLSKKEFKAWSKAEKKELKEKEKADKKSNPNIFVIDFEGDIQASAVDRLRDEISAIMTVLKPEDSVLVRVESPGGSVHGYGLAASQLARIRNSKSTLIVSVDKVAASGGYMMACVANRILAAPFAIVGSIGVVAQVPNFHKLLKKHDVDYEEITSGEYKRTVSIFGEITDKGKQKFTEQIEKTHGLFKDFVMEFRPQVNLSEVATGEYWFGTQALKLNLVDEVKTSDEFLFENLEQANIIKINLQQKKKFADLLNDSIGFLINLVLKRKVEF